MGGTVRPLGRGAALPQPPRSPRQLVCKTDMMIPESKIDPVETLPELENVKVPPPRARAKHLAARSLQETSLP